MIEFLNHQYYADGYDDDDNDYSNGQHHDQLSDLIVHGLGGGGGDGRTIQDDAEFFHPTMPPQRNSNYKNNQQDPPICSLPPDTDASIKLRNEMLQSRLDSIAMPESLNEIINAIDILGNTRDSKVGSWRSNITPQLAINYNMSKLSGAVVAVAHVGELAYLARASGLVAPPVFFEPAATSGIYNLLAWHDWRRRVTDIGTTEAAMLGAVKVTRILNVLEAGRRDEHEMEEEVENGNSTHNHEDDDGDQFHHHYHAITIFVGHDDDFAAVATALGLNWNLPAPYTTGKSDDYYNAVPPGAALHFYYNPDKTSTANDDDDDDSHPSSPSVQISILAPVMLSSASSSSSSPHHHHAHAHYEEVLNTTGILEERPVHLSSHFAQIMQDHGFASVSSGTPSNPTLRVGPPHSQTNYKTGIDHLRDRLHNILSTAFPPEAIECLNNVTQKYRPQQHLNDDPISLAGLSSSSLSASSSPAPPSVNGLAFATLAAALSLVFMGVVIVILGTKRLKMAGDAVKKSRHQQHPFTTSVDINRCRTSPQTEMTSIIIPTTCATSTEP
jgi:hypothetical protein